MVQEIKEVKESVKDKLGKIPGVVAVSVGYKTKKGNPTNQLSIRVFVEKKKAKGKLKKAHVIPSSYKTKDGKKIPVDVVEMGSAVKFTAGVYTDTYRPAKPGACLGHVNSQYSGTYGAVVIDNKDGKKSILSCSHVLANFNDAKVGDKILQTAPQYGGSSPDQDFATLKRFIPLNLANGDHNLVDAAIAKPNVNREAKRAPFSRSINVRKQCAVGMLWSAGAVFTVLNPIDTVLSMMDVRFPVTKTALPQIGMQIHGDTAYTGYLPTHITDIHATVYVSFGSGLIAFDDQIMAPGGIGEAIFGDSGAVFYTQSNC